MDKPRYVTFDAHIHVMTTSRLRAGWRWVQKFSREPLGPAPTPAGMVQGVRLAGLRGYFNLFFPLFRDSSRYVNEWNDGFCSAQTAAPWALPFLSIHPEDTAQERTYLVREFLLKRRFAGLKIHSYIQNLRLDLPWLREVCAVLAEHKRLLLVHTGFSRPYDSDYGEEEMAEHVAALLEEFPDLMVIAAHMFYPRMDLAFQMMAEYTNLLLDVTGVPMISDSGDQQVELWMPYWERYADRIIFGSDYGLRPHSLETVIDRFERLPLSEESLRKIGGETVQRILASNGLRPDARQWMD